jgi:arsenate reductase-like glutaredoxin family protein
MKTGAPKDADLLKAILGPTGNLRAPTIRRGQTLLVGFSEEVYAKTLG